MNSRARSRGQSGFTLLELLIVAAVFQIADGIQVVSMSALRGSTVRVE